MHKKLFSVLYAINIISQAIFTLLIPAALGFGLAWLFVTKCNAPEWLYAVLIPLGIVAGLVSMGIIPLVLCALKGDDDVNEYGEKPIK